ncbi:MAG: hypothetical protein MK033_07285 [Candidatus Caenarcaniphilales bacterium]|nr:hypothetical protein [Candidatus Caenarcaniphilales bacterium]
MNTEFTGILQSQARLTEELGKPRNSSSIRAIAKIQSSPIYSGKTGTPVKVKTDYQEVMRLRESDI